MVDSALITLCREYLDFQTSNDLAHRIRANPFEASRLVENIETFLKRRLEGDPTNTDLFLKLAVCQLLTPLEDYESSAESCRRILQLESGNIKGKLLLAFIEDRHLGHISEGTVSELRSIENTKNVYLSAKEGLIAVSYNEKNSALYVDHLRKALMYYECNLTAAIGLIQSRMTVTKITSEEADILKIALRCSKDYILKRTKSFAETDILDFDMFMMDSIFGLNRKDHDCLEQLFLKFK